MAAESMLSRRSAFGLTAGALVAGWALPTVAAAAEAIVAWTPRALSAAQAAVLSAAAEAMLPATDTPGAVAAGVPQFVDRTLADWSPPEDTARIRAALDRLDADARAAHGTSFAGLAPPQRTAILKARDAEARKAKAPDGFRQLKDLVTVGYFTSKPGATQALRYDPVPGAYHGCVPVKTIGRAWAT
jgi:hypothetical protein